MDFWTQNSWIVPSIVISLWTMIWSIDWWGCVKDLKLVRSHNKEVKGLKKINWILRLYLWTFEWVNKEHFLI
jgi:hypothetical protein